MPLKSVSTALAILLLQANPSEAWTSSYTPMSSNPESDDVMKVSVRSLSGDATITFQCNEGGIYAQLENHRGVNLGGPAAVYAGGKQIGADGMGQTIAFANMPQVVDLARHFMATKGNVEVRYNAKATPRDFHDAFPAAGATKALSPLFASGLCGVE